MALPFLVLVPDSSMFSVLPFACRWSARIPPWQRSNRDYKFRAV
jgi:hypothetical protein